MRIEQSTRQTPEQLPSKAYVYAVGNSSVRDGSSYRIYHNGSIIFGLSSLDEVVRIIKERKITEILPWLDETDNEDLKKRDPKARTLFIEERNILKEKLPDLKHPPDPVPPNTADWLPKT